MNTRLTLFTGLALYLGFASTSALFPVYTLPAAPLPTALVFLGLSVFLAWFGSRPAPAGSPLRALVPGVAALLLLFFLPEHGLPAMTLVAAGSLLLLLKDRLARRLGAALRLAGYGGLAGFVGIKFSIYLHTMIERDLPIGWLAERVARLAGTDAAVLGNELVLRLPDESLPFSLGPEWTGLYYRIFALGLLLAMGLAARSRFSRLGPALLLCALGGWVWAGVAFPVQSLLAAMLYQFEIPWSPVYQFFLGLPPVLLAARLAAWTSPKEAAPAETPTAGWLPALASLCLLLALCFHFPGSEKPGRVLIDDGHSDWEWVGDPMNTRQFGTRTTYNYHGLGSLLKRHYSATVNFEELTPALLDTVDVLILKTPTRAYSESEQEAVLEFVHKGGGLYTISDHTDVFGMSTFLNEITQHFGFIYNKDTVFDLNTTNDQFWEQQDVIPHPAMQHLPWYRYLTGCSVKPGWRSGLAAVGTQCGSDLLSYNTSNFFDVYYPRTELRAGNLVQVVSARYGRGRVLGFSDSTTYSNFAMFLPGRFEHLMGIVQYLNRISFPLQAFWLFLFLALALALAAVRKGQLVVSRMPDHLLLAAAVVVPLVLALNAAIYDLPERRHSLEGVALDEDLSDILLPRKNKIEDNDPRNMETAYIWLYRSGRIPELSRQHIEPDTKQYVILNPERAPEDGFRGELLDFVKSGGELLVAAGNELPDAALEDWLSDYGLSFGRELSRNVLVEGANHDLPIFLESAIPVQGGQPFYRLEDGTPVASEVRIGEGRVILSGLAESFNNAHLGRYDSIPSELAYEYLQMYYRHTGMSGGEIEAEAARPGL